MKLDFQHQQSERTNMNITVLWGGVLWLPARAHVQALNGTASHHRRTSELAFPVLQGLFFLKEKSKQETTTIEVAADTGSNRTTSPWSPGRSMQSPRATPTAPRRRAPPPRRRNPKQRTQRTARMPPSQRTPGTSRTPRRNRRRRRSTAGTRHLQRAEASGTASSRRRRRRGRRPPRRPPSAPRSRWWVPPGR
uniref:Uncharacterized protein n=1 Tax=Triticum urartu TaxID=4572 RepID=A0A8R7P1E9_TRIUA